ncbi:hypothetical protein FQR65_LT13538 [Abscondita terminalis]|nr:hypothetical protein FQR65_LT13538 [Abscondita terminalis]
MFRKPPLLEIINCYKYRSMLPKQMVINNVNPNLTLYENFETIHNKNRNTYLEMVKLFSKRDVYRRGHVEFIYSALKNMRDFNVEKDLDVYKALIDVLPKGKFIPVNMFQTEFMHYPKQQQCAIDLLEQMEDNAVIPDKEVEDMLLNIFGKKGFPLRKFWRMMYWMPKFKNLTPWLLPHPLPNDMLELAKLAVTRITSVDIQSKITIYKTKDIPEALEKSWVVSGQSQTQRRLISENNVKKPIYVEGSFRIWLKNIPVNYFILRADPKPILKVKYEDDDDVSNISIPLFDFMPPPKKEVVRVPSVHEQDDGVILAVCVTETSGRDSLLSWIRHLEKDENPELSTIPVVFRLKSPEKEIANFINMAHPN